MKRRLGTNSNQQPRGPKSGALITWLRGRFSSSCEKNESKLGKTEMSFRADFIS